MCIPSVEEQRQIVSLLDSSERLLATSQSLLQALTSRKAHILEELLRDVATSEAGHGAVPLSSAVNLVTDRSVHNGPTLCVDLQHIVGGQGRLIHDRTSQVSSGDKLRFRRGDVLFGKLRPYLRKSWLADQEGNCSGEIWVLRTNSIKLSPQFLSYFVQSAAFISATNVVSGSKMPRADWRLVSRLLVNLPAIKRQQEIVDLLTACDSEIELARERLGIQRELHGQLVVEATTGKCRYRGCHRD